MLNVEFKILSNLCMQTEIGFDNWEGPTVFSKDGMKKMHPALADIYDAGCNVR